MVGWGRGGWKPQYRTTKCDWLPLFWNHWPPIIDIIRKMPKPELTLLNLHTHANEHACWCRLRLWIIPGFTPPQQILPPVLHTCRQRATPQHPTTHLTRWGDSLGSPSFFPLYAPEMDGVIWTHREKNMASEIVWHPPILHLPTPGNRSERLFPWGTQTLRPGQVLPWYSSSAEISHNWPNWSHKALRW